MKVINAGSMPEHKLTAYVRRLIGDRHNVLITGLEEEELCGRIEEEILGSLDSFERLAVTSKLTFNDSALEFTVLGSGG